MNDNWIAYSVVGAFGLLFITVVAPWLTIALAAMLWAIIGLLYAAAYLLDVIERRAARKTGPAPDPVGDAIRAENLRRADATYFSTTA